MSINDGSSFFSIFSSKITLSISKLLLLSFMSHFRLFLAPSMSPGDQSVIIDFIMTHDQGLLLVRCFILGNSVNHFLTLHMMKQFHFELNTKFSHIATKSYLLLDTRRIPGDSGIMRRGKRLARKINPDVAANQCQLQ